MKTFIRNVSRGAIAMLLLLLVVQVTHAESQEVLMQVVFVGGEAPVISESLDEDDFNESSAIGEPRIPDSEDSVEAPLESSGNTSEQMLTDEDDSNVIALQVTSESELTLADRVQEWRKRGRALVARSEVSGFAALATVAATLAGISLAGVSLGSLFKTLFQVITEPFRGLTMRKHKQWGVVVNTFTKQPVDLATVRLLSTSNQAVVKTLVTDKQGRYLFLVPSGSYKVSVSREGYENYTSATLDHADGDTNTEQLIHDDIDLDPSVGTVPVAGSAKVVGTALVTERRWVHATDRERVAEDAKIRRSLYVKKFWSAISWVGSVLSLVMLILRPSVLLVGLFVLHVLLLYVFRRVAHKRQGKPWGRVLNARTRRPVGGAVVRLFDAKHGRVLLSQLSTGTGQYAFLTGDSDYLISASKNGYILPGGTSKVKQSGGTVAQDLGLRKSKQ